MLEGEEEERTRIARGEEHGEALGGDDYHERNESEIKINRSDIFLTAPFGGYEVHNKILFATLKIVFMKR
jgi:hypothetical protein